MKTLISSTKFRYALISAIVVAFIIILSVHSHVNNPSPNSDSVNLPSTPQQVESMSNNVAPVPITVTVQKGETLAEIFNNLNISNAMLERLNRIHVAGNNITQIHPGQKLTFTFNTQSQLSELTIALSLNKFLHIDFTPTTAQAHLEIVPLTSKLHYYHGTVTYSFNQAAMQAGLNRNVTAKLVHIFSGKINFSTQVHKGDHFTLLYRQYYLHGKQTSKGNIAAAEYFSGKKHYTAIYYKNPTGHSGFYMPNGRNIELSMQRYPVHFTRISSRFTYRRLDPYLHVYRPHLGVDFAAPWGTPVHAVGDGYIKYAGKRGGYGNAIVVEYGPHIHTLNGHLSRFAKHLHKGERVHQGQVIGYIGSTGWSTGPHLHYGVFIRGVAVNPLKFKLPGGPPVAHKYLAAFKQRASTMQKTLTELQTHA